MKILRAEISGALRHFLRLFLIELVHLFTQSGTFLLHFADGNILFSKFLEIAHRLVGVFLRLAENSLAADALLDACKEKKLPLVLCTTGLTEDQLQKVQETSKEIPVLRSANMSLGVNTLMKLVQAAAKVLAEAGFDMEIVEKHHKLKCDAPSGTAIALADSLNAAMDNQYHYVYDRSQRHEQRDPKEIGISAVRGGTIVGDHDVIFAGPDEVVTLSHRAYSKGVFGKGAVEAAKFLAGKPAGMYDMQDVIAAK